MPFILSLALVLCNLLLLIISVGLIFSAVGAAWPLAYINATFSSSSGRLSAGAVGIVMALLAIIILISILKNNHSSQSVVIDQNLTGQISITVPALKVIIMKAVKNIEGIKDIRSAVTSRPEGLQIYLHLMVNPDYSMEEMGTNIQAVVKKQVETIGGVQVAAVKILVDDFNVTRRPVFK